MYEPVGYTMAFDPYEEAKSVTKCPVCGTPLYYGDTIFVQGGECIGCENCTESQEVDYDGE